MEKTDDGEHSAEAPAALSVAVKVNLSDYVDKNYFRIWFPWSAGTATSADTS
jgi:hypothetical protein